MCLFNMISFDYSRKNYANTSFDFGSILMNSNINNAINENFRVSNSYRIGTEFRQKKFSFRGGYKLIESPYKNKDIYGDLSGVSFGLGYNFGNSRIDLSYLNNQRKISQSLFNQGDLGSATIDSNIADITLSLSINL